MTVLDKFKDKKILITFHINSDIDAVASAFSLQNMVGGTVAHYGRIDHDAKTFLKFFKRTPEKFEDINIKDFDAIIALDVQNYGLLPHLRGITIDLLIDHHDFTSKEMDVKEKIIEKDASSTCEILYGLFDKEKIDAETAEMLMCGIMADTLRFKEVSSKTFFICSELQKICGLSYGKLLEITEPRLPMSERIGFIKSAKTLEYDTEEDKIIVIGTAPSFAGNICTILSENIADVAFIAVPREEKTKIKISARTWLGSGVDLTEIIKVLAEKFGGEGGGHPYAAGINFDTDDPAPILKECMHQAKKQIKESFKKK